MRCENCGAEIQDDAPFCPECGEEPRITPLDTSVVDHAPLLAPASERDLAVEPQGLSAWVWVLAAALMVTCVLLGFLSAGMMGVYEGLQERARLNREAAVEHYHKGLARLEAGEHELAIAEFEQALRLSPGYPEAQEKIREIRAQMQAEVPTPTPTSETVNQAVDTLYNQAKSLYDQGRWEEAALRSLQLQELAPLYRTGEVENLLFSAYYKNAMQLVDEGRLEEALRNFDKALEVRPDDPAVLEQRELVSLYLTGLGYWNADWNRTIKVFSELYQLEPGYKDVEQRLYEAYVSYGDYLGEQESWCSAESQYAEAMRIKRSDTLSQKQNDAAYLCQTATPTLAITVTVPATLTVPPVATATVTSTLITTPSSTSLPSPTSVPNSGNIAYALRDTDGVYRIYVAEPDGGEPVMVVEEADQPAFSPDGTRIAFHSWRSGEAGIRMINIDGSDEVEVSRYPEDVIPAWSPDGKKIVFASNRAGDRRWRVYLVWLGAEAVELTLGRVPTWSPDGRIVYRGCNPQGGDCGLFIMGEDGVNQARLTADESDTVPACSPDGKRIAFTSSRDGNWEIYAVSSGGGTAKRLTNDPGNDGLPTWSPDGNRIAFISDRDGSWGIYLMNADGGDQKKIITLEGVYQNWQSERISWTR